MPNFFLLGEDVVGTFHAEQLREVPEETEPTYSPRDDM